MEQTTQLQIHAALKKKGHREVLSHNNLTDRQVLQRTQVRLPLDAIIGEHHLRGSQPRPHTTEALIESSRRGVHQVLVPFQNDIPVVDVEAQISEPSLDPVGPWCRTNHLMSLSEYNTGKFQDDTTVDVAAPISAPDNPPLTIVDPISGLEVGLFGHHNYQISLPEGREQNTSSLGDVYITITLPEGPEQNTGGLGDVVPSISVLNQSNPIWHLMCLAASNLAAAFTAVVFILPTVHPTYRRVILIMIVIVAIALAAISLLISCWLARDPAGRGNWIKGLLVANYCMIAMFSVLGCKHWAFKHGTGN